MQQAMQEDAAVYRVGDTLQSGVKRIAAVREKIARRSVSDQGLILEHRPDRDAGIHQPAGQATVTVAGALDEETAAQPRREDFPTATTSTG